MHVTVKITTPIEHSQPCQGHVSIKSFERELRFQKASKVTFMILRGLEVFMGVTGVGGILIELYTRGVNNVFNPSHGDLWGHISCTLAAFYSGLFVSHAEEV